MAKTIQMVLFNDDLKGSRMATLDKYVCHNILRKDDQLIKELSEDLSKPALYILMNKQLSKAYIGQTDDFSQRIAQHLSKKPFWNEFVVFTANDNSLTTTEVRYLEAVAYETAAEANHYDLSENGQVPSKPYATAIQKINIKEFFKNAKTLASLIDCDIFDSSSTPVIQIVSNEQDITNPPIQELGVTAKDLEGKCKLSLNNYPATTKNKFFFTIVKEYLKYWPQTSFVQLKQIFPNSLLGSWNRWPILEDNIEKARNWTEYGDVKKRHLIEDEYVLQSGDGVKFVVCTEWDKSNILNLIAIINKLGWKYKIEL